MTDLLDLGAQCFFWEMATAVAGWRLAINPFDQPNVEASKASARKIIDVYRETGQIPPEQPSLEAPGITVYGTVAPCVPGSSEAVG
jgi:glucose-6-phosphate isomerase